MSTAIRRLTGSIPVFGRERPPEYKYIAAIDFGTARSAVAYWVYDLSALAFGARVNIGPTVNGAGTLRAGNKDAGDKSDTVIVYRALGMPTERAEIGPAALTSALDDAESNPTGTDEDYVARDFKMLLDVKSRREREHGEVSLKETTVPLHSTRGGKVVTRPLLRVIADYLQAAASVVLEKLQAEPARTVRGAVAPLPEGFGSIHWVVTVPAIWTDQARIFMREAMFEAGLCSGPDAFSPNVDVCLEPEGAALEIFAEILGRAGGELSEVCKKDSSFAVIDLGGGTADITLSKISTFLHATGAVGFEEVHHPTGGPWGGRCIDLALEEQLLKPLLGDHFAQYIASPAAKLRFYEKAWHLIKYRFDNKSETVLISLQDIGENLDISIAAVISANLPAINARLSQNMQIQAVKSKLALPRAFLAHLFQVSLAPLIAHLTDLLRQHEIHFAVLAGGLGNNAFVQATLKDFFASTIGKPLVVAESPSTAIVSGAIRFGLNKEPFGLRRARTNYGIALYNPNGAHLFYPIINKGDDLRQVAKRTRYPDGEVQLGPFTPVTAEQTVVTCRIMEADTLVATVDEPGCFLVAEVPVPINMSVPHADRKMYVTFSMSGSTVSGVVVDASIADTSNDPTQGCTPIRWSSR